MTLLIKSASASQGLNFVHPFDKTPMCLKKLPLLLVWTDQSSVSLENSKHLLMDPNKNICPTSFALSACTLPWPPYVMNFLYDLCKWTPPFQLRVSWTLTEHFILFGVSGSWCAQGMFEPSEHLWRVWGLIKNAILPFLPSCWGFSFTLGHGVSPQSPSSAAQLVI